MAALILALGLLPVAWANAQPAPAPMLAKGKPVDWFFVYKFNTRSFPQCSGNAERSCLFGGNPVAYKLGYGQQYVMASSAEPELKERRRMSGRHRRGSCRHDL